VFEDHAFQQRFDDLLFFGAFELAFELRLGTAFGMRSVIDAEQLFSRMLNERRIRKVLSTVDGFDVRAIVQDWCSQGATLENPATQRFTSLSEEGDQVETSLELLEAAVWTVFR
jgi:hypothetical protein